MALYRRILDLLYPPKCVFCRALTEDGGEICPACAQKLLHLEGETRSGEFFSTCAAAFPYVEPIRTSIHRFKFRGAAHYADCYGKLMAACVVRELSGRFDLVSWVPVSARRRRERGYDQAKLLCHALCRQLRTKEIRTLRKKVDNPAQSGLEDAKQRRANVLGVYTPVHPERISGKRILLIDDIITTGATLSECSRVLLTAGAGEVVCAVLAAAQRTKGNDDDVQTDE